MNFKIMSQVDYAKLVGNIGKSGVKLDAQIQMAAVTAIAYSINDRNVTPGQQLLEALTGGARKDALVSYFEKNGQFAWSKTSKKLEFFDVKKHTNKEIVFNDAVATELLGMAWHAAKKAPEIVSQYDFDKEATKFVERFKKLASDANVTVAHKELLNKVSQALADYHWTEYQKSTKVDENPEETKGTQKLTELPGIAQAA